MHSDSDDTTSAPICAHFSQDAGGDLVPSETDRASLRKKRLQVKSRAVFLAAFGLAAFPELLPKQGQ